ncbi:hypothetical protein AVL50_29835 [Flammeovirga sp. SJP92]|nr:hypothetical protein AVL50_29835 [Flammeovirga sp. SJP92]
MSCLLSCHKKDEKLKIIFTGDIILDRAVKYETRFHGDSLLVNAFNICEGHDFTVINLEGTITETGQKQKDRYNFKSEYKNARLLKEAGVTHVSIANNHIFDYGEEGYKNTIRTIEDNALEVLGHKNVPSIIKKGNKQCAILSASLTTHNENLSISSAKALKQSVEQFVRQHEEIPLILYLHWGYEMQTKPQRWQVDLATELIDLGVDAIIGHHPHVTQTIEFIKDKPVIYSLGNFIADPYMPEAKSCYVVSLEIDQEIKEVNITPVYLEKYFPKILTLENQIRALKEHLRYSNVALFQNGQRWKLKQTRHLHFSEPTSLWMISEKNTISMLKKLSDNSHLLKFEKGGVSANAVRLHGTLSEFQVGDINNDQQVDVLVGITKKVRFDPVLKKRVNIYTFKNKALKPLWLGTKFLNDVESFGILEGEHKNYLTTVEVVDEKNKVERVYEWDDFGFALTELN